MRIIRNFVAVLAVALVWLAAIVVPATACVRVRDTITTSCSSTVTGRASDLLYTDFVYRGGQLRTVFTTTQSETPTTLYLLGKDAAGVTIWSDIVDDTDYLWEVPRSVRGKLAEVRVQYIEPRYGRTTSANATDRPAGAKHANCEVRR